MRSTKSSPPTPGRELDAEDEEVPDNADEEEAPSSKNIRPIAIGETLRRLVGKVALSLPQTRKVSQVLQPTQLGVGAPRGTEQTAMLLQEALKIYTTKATWRNGRC
jgi:hypothetical protein